MLRRSDDNAASFFPAFVDVDLLCLLRLLVLLLLLVMPGVGVALTVGEPPVVRLGLAEAMPPVGGRKEGVIPRYVKSQSAMIAAVQ